MTSGPEIDSSKISTQLTQRAIDRLLSVAETAIKQRWAQYKNQHTPVFDNYVISQSQKCALVRTLIYDKQSGNLPDIYVPLRISRQVGHGRHIRRETLTTADLTRLFSEESDQKQNERKTFGAILSAPAGAGKTFFMRNLYLALVSSFQAKIPVYLEARELNRLPSTDFTGIVRLAFQLAGHNISEEQALDGLKHGLFSILIDGFDELRLSQEKHYAQVLDDASQTFQLCPIMVSGRPSQMLNAFAYLQHCELIPLDHKQSIELIKRQTYDESTKTSFISLMQSSLFESHSEFLELPLLCIVMLITYSDAGRISHQEHEFYEDAFNALWSKHDARKQAGYEREKYTGLDKNDFIKLLSAFCASSYISEQFSMRETEFDFNLKRAKELTDINVKYDAFAKDMTTSTSLMVMEGNTYRFSHRSFQEYFCAKYVLSLTDKELENGIDAASHRFETDSVLGFLHSICPDRIETVWVLPKLLKLARSIEKAETSFKNYERVFQGSDGMFLRKLRNIYEFEPSSDELASAIAAWRDLGLGAVKNLSELEEDPHWNLFLTDVFNFQNLLEKLSSKYDARSEMNKALLGSKRCP